MDSSARERIYNAVETLVSSRPLRDRLKSAGLLLLPVPVDAFPADSRRELFEQVIADLTKVSGRRDVGHLDKSIDTMDDPTAEAVARNIAKLLCVTSFDD